MINLSFNPFDYDFDSLEPKHLERLRTVSEGWYVEYKRQAVTPKSIAKSFAAFANHYGGWIFYGVQEADDGSHVAQAFPGIDQNSIHSLIEDLRNAARDIVTPSPYFEYRKLDGPCDEIGLSAGKSIIVVAIPIGPDAPYIHSDGRIYRRIADSSEPKPETDRFVLDNLWHRRQLAREKLAAFLESAQLLSESEETVSYIDIFLLPDPLGLGNQIVELSFNEFIQFMSEPPPPELKPNMFIKFDNFFTMANGMIARHVYTNDPYRLNLTWRLYSNGFTIISIPFSSALASDIHSGGWLRHYNQEQAFIKLLRQGQYNHSYVLDLNELYIILMAVLDQNRKLLEISGLRGPYYAKAILRNVWRRIPFIDIELFIHFIQKCGMPVIQFETQYTPSGKDFETLVRLPDIDYQPTSNIDTSQNNSNALPEVWVNDVAGIFGHIINGLGLPFSAIFDENESQKEENSLWKAQQRVATVNKWRTQKDNE